MTDIVKRLLEPPPQGFVLNPLHVEAANEINRLTAALREIRCTCDEHCSPYKSGCDHWIAHEALGFIDD